MNLSVAFKIWEEDKTDGDANKIFADAVQKFRDDNDPILLIGPRSVDMRTQYCEGNCIFRH